MSSPSLRPLIDTCQKCSTSPANHEPRSPANGVFKIQGFVRKRFLPSPPLPPPFFFWLSPPFSAQAKYRKPRYSVFLCSQTLRKRLLRRLRNHFKWYQYPTGYYCYKLSCRSDQVAGKFQSPFWKVLLIFVLQME